MCLAHVDQSTQLICCRVDSCWFVANIYIYMCIERKEKHRRRNLNKILIAKQAINLGMCVHTLQFIKKSVGLCLIRKSAKADNSIKHEVNFSGQTLLIYFLIFFSEKKPLFSWLSHCVSKFSVCLQIILRFFSCSFSLFVRSLCVARKRMKKKEKEEKNGFYDAIRNMILA